MWRLATPECNCSCDVVVAVCDGEDSTEDLIQTGDLVEVRLALLSDL
jgi:hypothetical protein